MSKIRVVGEAKEEVRTREWRYVRSNRNDPSHRFLSPVHPTRESAIRDAWLDCVLLLTRAVVATSDEKLAKVIGEVLASVPPNPTDEQALLGVARVNELFAGGFRDGWTNAAWEIRIDRIETVVTGEVPMP